MSKNHRFKSVLHVWDMAAVSCILSKYLAQEGFVSTVMMRKRFDPGGMIPHYGQKYFREPIQRPKVVLYVIILVQILLNARRYDIIHMHSMYRIIPLLKAIYPRKKVVLHHHDSAITLMKMDPLVDRYGQQADLVIAAATVIEEAVKGSVYLPTITDTEMFRPLEHMRAERKNMALMVSIRYLDTDKAKKFLADQGCPYKYEVLDREKTFVPYEKLPRFLNGYKAFIDIRFVAPTDGGDAKLVAAMSKTGLEALACGLEVYDFHGRMTKDLPERHKPGNVVKKLLAYYDSMYK